MLTTFALRGTSIQSYIIVKHSGACLGSVQLCYTNATTSTFSEWLRPLLLSIPYVFSSSQWQLALPFHAFLFIIIFIPAFFAALCSRMTCVWQHDHHHHHLQHWLRWQLRYTEVYACTILLLIQTSCHKHNHTCYFLASLALPAVLHFCVGGFYGFIWPMMS